MEPEDGVNRVLASRNVLAGTIAERGLVYPEVFGEVASEIGSALPHHFAGLGVHDDAVDVDMGFPAVHADIESPHGTGLARAAAIEEKVGPQRFADLEEVRDGRIKGAGLVARINGEMLSAVIVGDALEGAEIRNSLGAVCREGQAAGFCLEVVLRCAQDNREAHGGVLSGLVMVWESPTANGRLRGS